MLLDNSIEEPCATELPTPSLYLLVSVLLYETNISNTISVTIPISSVWKQIYFYSEKKKLPQTPIQLQIHLADMFKENQISLLTLI